MVSVGPVPKDAQPNFYNPLNLRPGDFITFDEPTGPLKSLFARTFSIYEVAEFTRKIGPKKFIFTDYQLRDGDAYANVRVIPDPDAEETDRTPYNVIVLQPDHEMEYNEDFHKHVLPTGILEQRDGNTITATYVRLNGVQTPWAAKVRVMKRDGEWGLDELDYWDYGRTVEMDGARTEYTIVEMNKATGFFNMYKGYDIDPASLKVVPRQ